LQVDKFVPVFGHSDILAKSTKIEASDSKNNPV